MKILLYRMGFLGDVLMSTSCLRGIKQKHPDCELAYATWKQCAELLALSPYVDIMVVPGHYYATDYMPNVVDFRHEAFVDGYHKEGLPKGWYTRLVSKYPNVYWGKLHAMQCAEKGLLDLGEMESFKPDFFIGPADTATKKSEKLCVVNAWSQNGLNWRLWDKWTELIPELQKMGYRIVHVGGPGDPEIPCDMDLRGKTRVAQVAGVLAIADLCVAIDSFVAHVAHADKYVRDVEADKIEEIGGSTPTVLLAGPVAPGCVVPTDAKCVPVSSYPDCDGPCGVSHPGTPAGRICRFRNSCMKELSVEKVIEGVERCLGD